MQESVVLGFSGGIDSCTAARLLMEQGYRVVALTIDTIGDSAMLDKARQAAEALGAEWICYDAREEFNKKIIDYFCHAYSSGLTPAPCTRCNTHIKWHILKHVADKQGIYHIATGHYFQIEKHDTRYYVSRAADSTKDQSYYLWGLSQEILARTLTPMGNIIKSEAKACFEDKSESMGICFLGRCHYATFLAERGIAMTEGEVVTLDGRVCGRHNGIARYTAGQRRGEGIPEGMRVHDVDAATNRVRVCENSSLYKHTLYINDFNVVDIDELLSADDIVVKIRGIGRNPEQYINVALDSKQLVVTLQDAAWAPAKGQPLVFYRKNRVIGGGIVVGFK